MLKTNGLILDFPFHNIKHNIDMLDNLNFLVIVSVKYCQLIVEVYL
jgi:hypothetical protein